MIISQIIQQYKTLRSASLIISQTINTSRIIIFIIILFFKRSGGDLIRRVLTTAGIFLFFAIVYCQ